MKFMLNNIKKDDVPVLYEISNLSRKGWYYFKLDSKEYSLFPYEQEVLFSSGSYYDIQDITE